MPVPNSFANVTTSIPLSQLDANFNTPITLGNTAIQLGNTVTTLNNMTLANATVSSGNVTVTSASVSGNLTFTGTGNRILGDFSNATLANRVAFQTSTTNSNTALTVLPNGTATTSTLLQFNNSDQTNAGFGGIQVTSAIVNFLSGITGTGTYLPITFTTGGSERMRIDTSGNVGIGTSSPSSYAKFASVGTSGSPQGFIGTTGNGWYFNTFDSGTGYLTYSASNVTAAGFGAAANIPLFFMTNNTERMRITSAGDVGIGTTSPTAKLDVSSGGLAANFASSTAFSGALWKSSTTTGFGRYIAAEADVMTFGRYGVAENMRIDSSGNVGIGTSSPTTILNAYHATSAAISVDGDSTTQLRASRYSTDTSSASLVLTKARGTLASPTAVASGDLAGQINLNSYGGTNYRSVVQIQAFCETYTADDNISGYLKFNTRPTGAGGVITERMRIDASGYTQFSSNLVMPYQGAPTSKAGAATLTGAELVTGILNTTGTTYTITLPTGTNIEGALTWVGNNVCLDWFVINTASGTITIGANGNTTLGGLTIATGTSAHFRIRRTAANTFTVYRL